jgi:hypothetical protein
LAKGLSNYSNHWQIINPRDLGIKQNRPRLFIWGKMHQHSQRNL